MFNIMKYNTEQFIKGLFKIDSNLHALGWTLPVSQHTQIHLQQYEASLRTKK